jgi:hypothetical protein
MSVDPKMLAQYAGNYEVSPTFSIAITIQGRQLMSQATGQSKIPFHAESETKFFSTVVDAEVEFFNNDKGEIGYLMLHQDGQEVKGVKK